eukprot:6205181-Pleurochrysis_carterae.AAC.1
MPSQVNRLWTFYNFLSAFGWTICLHGYRPATRPILLSLNMGILSRRKDGSVVYSMQHAQAVFFNLYTPYAMDAPSPVDPTFVFPVIPAASVAAGPTKPSTPAGATPAAAPLTGAPPISSVRLLTADESDHFVISPEQIASVNRQLMEKIFSTIAWTRPVSREMH